MNDFIREKYQSKAVIYGNIWMYFVKTAEDVIADCQKNNLKVVGLEAFKLTGEGIQPSQEHSVDFNSSEENWQKAVEFLCNVEDLTYLYEIWYEGY